MVQSFVPTVSTSAIDMQGQNQTSVTNQPGNHSLDALLTAVELTDNVENKFD